jgi:hypothetical protein
MKYLLSSVAIVAALAVTAPVSAQRTGPGAGAGETTGPGVNPPGGPGPSSPLSNLPAGSPGIPGTPSSGPATRAYSPPAPAAAAPGIPPGTAPGTETTSAAPPTHRHARPHHGHVAAHTTTKGEPVSGNPNTSANQMNADELARLQAGETGNPPPSALPYSEAPSTQGDTGRGPGRQLRSLNAPGR